jgi:CubicO group peptidase (beta-lactamase class C family)
MTVTELLALTKNKPLNFTPGTDFKYSNTGYVILGAVIEKASGQNYANYIQSHIFAPAGMTSSYYDAANRVIPHRVPGYTREGKEWGNAPYISMTQPYSAGSLLSTVDDMWNWEQALESGKLVNVELLTQAQTTGQLPDGRSTNYGFGWEIDRLGAHMAVQHGGGMPGFYAHELKIPDAEIFIVILCNGSEPAESPRSLASRIARLLLNEAKPENETTESAALEDYVGKYRVGPGQNLEISVVDGKLMGRLGGQRPLHAVDVDTFSTAGNEMRLTFLRNAENKVDRVLAGPDAPGPGMTWQRE